MKEIIITVTAKTRLDTDEFWGLVESVKERVESVWHIDEVTSCGVGAFRSPSAHEKRYEAWVLVPFDNPVFNQAMSHPALDSKARLFPSRESAAKYAGGAGDWIPLELNLSEARALRAERRGQYGRVPYAREDVTRLTMVIERYERELA